MKKIISLILPLILLAGCIFVPGTAVYASAWGNMDSYPLKVNSTISLNKADTKKAKEYQEYKVYYYLNGKKEYDSYKYVCYKFKAPKSGVYNVTVKGSGKGSLSLVQFGSDKYDTGIMDCDWDDAQRKSKKYSINISMNKNDVCYLVLFHNYNRQYSSVSTKVEKMMPKAVSTTANSIKLTWPKELDEDGYQVQQYKKNKWCTIKTINKNKNSCTVSGLSAAKAYKFRVRSYHNEPNDGKLGSKKVYSKWSFASTITTKYNVNTSVSSLKSKKSRQITIKWKKVKASGYQIQYSTSSKFKSAKTVTVSKNKTTSKTISKLKAKKKYYVRIRTYKTVKVNGKNTKLYSSWSKTKSVTTKK